MNPAEPADHFLSEDDLNLRDLSWEELLVQWDAWLRVASATDEEDAGEYEHGVFVRLREESPHSPDRLPLGPLTSATGGQSDVRKGSAFFTEPRG